MDSRTCFVRPLSLSFRIPSSSHSNACLSTQITSHPLSSTFLPRHRFNLRRASSTPSFPFLPHTSPLPSILRVTPCCQSQSSATSRYLQSLSSTDMTPPVLPPVDKSSAPPPTQTVFSLGPLTLRLSSRFLLCLVPLVWSTFLICAKLLYSLPRSVSPVVFNGLRLTISTAMFVPGVLEELRKTRADPSRKSIMFPGIKLGALVFCSNMLQLLGLRYTTMSRAAFINQLSAVIVPLAAAALAIEPLNWHVAGGAFSAVIGIGLLTAPSAATGPLTRVGDLLELSSSAFTSCYVLYTSSLSKRFPAAQHSPLNGVKIATQLAIALLWIISAAVFNKARTSFSSVKTVVPAAAKAAASAVAPWTPSIIFVNFLMILWAGTMVSAFSSWLQTRGQAGVPAGESAILFAAQPVWASLWAAIFFGERMSRTGMIGATLIVLGAIIASIGRNRKNKPAS